MHKKGTLSWNTGTGLLSRNRRHSSLTPCRSASPTSIGGRSARAFAHDDALRRSTDTLVSECIRTSSLFAGLPEASEQEVRGAVIERSFSSREIIFREDDPVRFVDVIAWGLVKTTQLGQEGSEVILRVDCAGCPLDGMGETSESVHTTTAWAVRDCLILSWESSIFANFLERFPVIQRNATVIMKRRLKMLEQAFCDLSTARAPQRLARILLRLTTHPPCNTLDSVGLSREELAQMIGTSLFTTSRLLSDWAERQIVYVSRGGVLIENLQALEALAEQTGVAGEDFSEML